MKAVINKYLAILCSFEQACLELNFFNEPTQQSQFLQEKELFQEKKISSHNSRMFAQAANWQRKRGGGGGKRV
jgi:hypothetical protein